MSKSVKESLLRKIREGRTDEITDEEWDLYEKYVIEKGKNYHKEKYGKDWESSISNRVISLWKRLQNAWKNE